LSEFKEFQKFVFDCPQYDDPALGLPGEVGEVLELVKKDRRQGDRRKPIDIEKLTLEIYDVLFYAVQLSSLYEIKLDDIIVAGNKKLTKRHDL